MNSWGWLGDDEIIVTVNIVVLKSTYSKSELNTLPDFQLFFSFPFFKKKIPQINMRQETVGLVGLSDLVFIKICKKKVYFNFAMRIHISRLPFHASAFAVSCLCKFKSELPEAAKRWVGAVASRGNNYGEIR